ncbi:MAG: adenylate/guanylate cyclase domain-containing protein [Planctomycetaceae bacterium]
MNDSAIRELMNEAMHQEHHGSFLSACEKLRQVVTHGGDGSLALDARLRLGKLLVSLRDSNEATACLTEARERAQQKGAVQATATAIHLLALLERQQHRYAEATRLLEQSPVVTRIESPTAETGQWWHYRGLVVADQGDLAQGERMLFRAHQVYKELNNRAGLAEVCDSLANLLLRHGKTRVALVFAEESLKWKRELADRYGEAISLGTLGRTYLLQAKYDEAAGMFAADLAIARELGDGNGAGQMLNCLGQVALLQNRWAEAVDAHQQSLQEVSSPFNAMHARLGLAWAYLASGNLDAASHECDGLAELLAAHPQARGMPTALLGLRGALTWRRGDCERGEQYLLEAIRELENQQLAADTIAFLYELRDLYRQQGRTAQAVKIMVRALTRLHECGAERGVADLENWLQTVDSPSLVRLALEQQLPEFLVEGILAGTLRRPPSRRQAVAVLFSDIRDYTTLTEGLAAEQVVELLNDWFSEATRVIQRHHGFVDKFIGDAVMAVFGVPEPRADAAADAVRAALDLREELAALNLRQRALGGREIRIGIGIAAGEVVAGFIGSYLRQSFTVIGDTVNVASRLESETKNLRCDILINGEAETQQARFGVAETQYHGKLSVKGCTQPVDVFQVQGKLHPPG